MLSLFSIVGTKQTVYASGLSRKEQTAYMKEIKKLEKEYVTDNQSLITDSNFAWGSLDQTYNYTFVDIDKDGKKEMIAIVTYQYPCFYARCFVFKYESSGKVKKIEIEHNANSGSINWVAVGLAKKYILFYDADWVVQYNRDRRE